MPGKEGNWTLHFPTGEVVSIYDAAMRYQEAGTPLVILTGKEYGTGSSRDWAAKGPALLGVKAIIAESYERIHRSNLVGMGVLPLAYRAGHRPEVAGPDRDRDVQHHGHRAGAGARRHGDGDGAGRGRQGDGVPGGGPAQLGGGAGLLPARGDPAAGAAAVPAAKGVG